MSNGIEGIGMAVFDMDLGLDEQRRRAAVYAAVDFDPGEAIAQEDAARALLYSGLDADQQRIFDELVVAGVLPGGLQRAAD